MIGPIPFQNVESRDLQELRARLAALGLDPGCLLHVGIPEVIDGQLVSYDSAWSSRCRAAAMPF